VISVIDAAGQEIQLGRELGKGGEGSVYEIPSDSSAVAKIYHRPLSAEKAEKLRAIAQLATPDLLKVAAWPTSTLHNNGIIVGFLMRRIELGMRPIHELYTPKTRLRQFPTANWDFLLHVATNVVRGFAAIHAKGHIVGDVNHGNLLVCSRGTTTFIDCDSFQVRRNG